MLRIIFRCNGGLNDPLGVRYSSIWLAKALPEDGQLISLEVSADNAKVCNSRSIVLYANNSSIFVTKIAQENIEYAKLGNKVKIIVGNAAETIKTLEPNPPFDIVFIDADKPGNLTYFLEGKRLVRKGGIIVRTFKKRVEILCPMPTIMFFIADC